MQPTDRDETVSFRDYLDSQFGHVLAGIRDLKRDLARLSERHSALEQRVTRLEQRADSHERSSERVAAMWRTVLLLLVPVAVGVLGYLLIQLIESLR